MDTLRDKAHTIVAISLFLCIGVCPKANAENDTYIPVHIDGFNTVLFNQQYPNGSFNMHSIVFGNPLDNYPFNILPFNNIPAIIPLDSFLTLKNNRTLRLQVSGKLGAETGEGMLNNFEGQQIENRDHFTLFTTGCSFPGTPLNCYFGYRYVDNYSDRFDGLWEKYENETGDPMKFSAEGLAKEYTGGYILNGPTTATALKITSYKHWGATPYYFSPVLSTGYQLSPSLIFALPKSKILVDFNFDYHKDYYNHIDFSEYTDEQWSVRWQHVMRNGIIAELSHQKDSRLKPSNSVGARLHDTIPKFMIWSLSSNIYSTYRLGGSIDLRYIQIPKFAFVLNTSWNNVPKPREYTFKENYRDVEYRTMQYENAALHSALEYSGRIFFPLKASLWLDYCEKPLWETIEFRDDRTIIRQDTVFNAARLTYGGKGAYYISLFNRLAITLWGNMAITQNKPQRFSLPLDAGVDIAYGKPASDELYAAVFFESRDRAALSYYIVNDDAIETTTSAAQTSASCILEIPFDVPFFKQFIQTNISIEAGPIRFSKEQRFQEHPKGNLIGPAISIGINGYFN